MNLCAKSIIRQFDIQKKGADKPVDATEHKLQDVAEEINLEEQQAAKLLKDYAINGEGNQNNDDTDGWINEMAMLSLAECTELQEEIGL